MQQNTAMKILFLTYHGFEEASGISKKMLAQVKGLRQNGHEVHICYYDVTAQHEHVRYVDGKAIKNYGRGWWSKLYQRMSYGCVRDYCVEHGIELVYVRCFMNASPFTVRLFRQLRNDGVKAVMEVPTYPYDKEFESLPLKYRVEHIADKLFRRQLASYMNAIVTFSDAAEIFGQRTIRISNGVDLDAIPLHSPLTSHQSPIPSGGAGGGLSHLSPFHVIGVAEVHPWHAFDRFVAGLGEYYRQHLTPTTHHLTPNTQHPEIYFHIVGGVPSDLMANDYTPLIEKYGLQDKVIFHGKLFGEELDKVFDLCCFAVGSLGRHRSGITHIKTLKNREYACRGIPFIYSECDSDFDHQPYVLKAPADESPIDIHQVVSFVRSHHFEPQMIRKTVEHLSWKNQMQQVIEQL